MPRPMDDVIDMLERLLDQHGHQTSLQDKDILSLDRPLKRYMYGGSPMHEVLMQSLDVFQTA